MGGFIVLFGPFFTHSYTVEEDSGRLTPIVTSELLPETSKPTETETEKIDHVLDCDGVVALRPLAVSRQDCGT